MVDVPLDGYRRFIDDFIAVVAQIPELLHYGRGAIDSSQVVLTFDDDSELVEKVLTEVRQIINRSPTRNWLDRRGFHPTSSERSDLSNAEVDARCPLRPASLLVGLP